MTLEATLSHLSDVLRQVSLSQLSDLAIHLPKEASSAQTEWDRFDSVLFDCFPKLVRLSLNGPPYWQASHSAPKAWKVELPMLSDRGCQIDAEFPRDDYPGHGPRRQSRVRRLNMQQNDLFLTANVMSKYY